MKRIIYSKSTAGLVAAALATAIVISPASASFEGVPGRLAFASDVGNGADIYTVMPDGQALHQLTDFAGFDACPSYSPDGKYIAWCSGTAPVFEIWVMKQNGTGKRQVTDLGGSSTFPKFSPDGETLAFAHRPVGLTYDIYTVNVDGTGLTQLTTEPVDDVNPAVSPDGSTIAFLSRRTGIYQVWLMDIDGANQRQLTFDPVPKDQLPDWSPDGTKIVYTAGSGTAFGGDIEVVDADGSNAVRLTATADLEFGPTWSPDGSKIAYVQIHGTSRKLHVMNADGTGDVALGVPGLHFVPTWQPRGDRLDG